MSESRYRILAVDDEEDALDVLQRVLEQEYTVLTARSGAEALEILRQEPVDLLITDQRMPQMSGIQLCEAAREIRPQMVRIIVTGYTEPRDLIDAINRGEVFRYITKPWDLVDLLMTVRNGLEAYQLRRDKERLLGDLELRLHAMTVFLDLSRDAAGASSHQELVEAVLRYLGFLVQYDLCAALVEQEGGRRALLHLHCRRPVHQDTLREVRAQVLADYPGLGGQPVDEKGLVLKISGEIGAPSSELEAFASSVQIVLRDEDAPIGLVRLYSSTPEAYRADTQQLLDILANQTSAIVRSLRAQLRGEQHRLELMVQSLADGVIMVDERDRVFVINPAARRLLHLSPDAPVDTRYLKDTLGFYPFDLVRGWAARAPAAVKEEIRVFDRALHSVVSPVLLDERLVGVAVVLRDMSEEKILEERKEEFVSIVSHELRTPLTSIGGALDLLLHRYAGELNPKQERYLSLAKGSCDKLNNIIDDLIDLNRYARGRLEMQAARLEIGPLAQEAGDAFQAAALERHVHLSLELPAEPLWVWADRNRLHQVLNNLLSNALKFSREDGRVELRVFVSEALRGFVGLSVTNDGDEIPEQDHERIFEKFEQARRSRPGAVSGSGLGLSISKSIVEAHGGRIWVESGRGQGTRFVCTLPRLEQEVAAGEPSQAVAPLEGGEVHFKNPPRLLVVDDDEATTYVLKGVLIGRGYSVMLAHDHQEALRLARERHPDLILMDVRMPQVDGLQLTDILHHDPETREIPVLVLSVLSSEEEAYRAGASAFLRKPVDLEALDGTVKRLLEQSNLVKRRFRVMVVDDDAAIRAVSREVLEGQGYAVLEADTGASALELLARSGADIVLLDVMLPDYDGFQVTERIRADRKLADVPIIFVSARGQTADKVRALKLGGDDYVTKPFDALELGARVESVLQRKERELDSSPTTKLPGSIAIDREIHRRLAAGKPFSLCYLDLDQLKAFNDHYGYAKADGVIHQTGDLIRKAVERHGTPHDFVGHVAGDDFVLVTEPERLEAIAQDIIQTFDRLIPLYYHPDDQARGYIEAEDRFGQLRRFGFMSISLAGVHVAAGSARSHAQISARAAELKRQAKAIAGSVLVQAPLAETDPENSQRGSGAAGS
jgi:CheY-like chemotaxis protein